MKFRGAMMTLGIAWSAMVAFELFITVVTKVVTASVVLALFLRGGLAVGSFRLAKTPLPKGAAVLYTLVPIVCVFVGLGLGAAPRSALGFLSFTRWTDGRFDPTPSVFWPEFGQTWVSASSFDVIALLVAAIFGLASLVALIQAAAQKA